MPHPHPFSLPLCILLRCPYFEKDHLLIPFCCVFWSILKCFPSVCVPTTKMSSPILTHCLAASYISVHIAIDPDEHVCFQYQLFIIKFNADTFCRFTQCCVDFLVFHVHSSVSFQCNSKTTTNESLGIFPANLDMVQGVYFHFPLRFGRISCELRLFRA